MRGIYLVLLLVLLQWKIVVPDEDRDIDPVYPSRDTDLVYPSICRKIAIPGYSRNYIAVEGDNWSVGTCPFGSVYDIEMCDCQRKWRAETVTRRHKIFRRTTTAATTTSTTTSKTTTTTSTSTTPTPTTTTEKLHVIRQPAVDVWGISIGIINTASITTAASGDVSTVENSSAIPPEITTREKHICDGCRFERGVGYVHHESDCNKYVMCYPVDINGTLKGEIRQCSIGQYWDQSALTCRPSTEVTCITDRCTFDPNLRSYAYESDCRGYWECETGISVGKCCPWGYAYKPDVGCRRDRNCNTSCDSKEIITDCDKRALEGNPSKFEQLTHGGRYITMSCPPGLVFINNVCKCDYKKNEPVSVKTAVCKKELDLDFGAGLKDLSGNNVHVEAINVTIASGIACFYGDGAIVVPRFANVDIGENIEIKVRYLLHKPNSKYKRRQALVYNGDCDFTSTVVAAVDSSGTYFGMSNNKGIYKHIKAKNKGKRRWIDATYSLHSSVMKVVVNGNEMSTNFYGSIARSRCGLKIGWGQDFDGFEGCIDKISISFCA